MSHRSRHRRSAPAALWLALLGLGGCLAPVPLPGICLVGPGAPPLPVQVDGTLGCDVLVRRNLTRDLSTLANVVRAPTITLDDLPLLDHVRLPAGLRQLGMLHLVDSIADEVALGDASVELLWIQRSSVRRVSGRQRQLRALVVHDARALATFDFPHLEELGELVLVDTDSVRVLAGFPALRRLGRLAVVDAEAFESVALPPDVRVERLESWFNPAFTAFVREAWVADQRLRVPAMGVQACGGPGLVRCLDDHELQ